MSPAVIFDVDGVLVDSYRAHFQSWRDVAAEHGLTLSEGQFAATFGQTSRTIIRRLWGEDLTDREVERFDQRKEARFRRLVAADFPTMDGAVELIAALREAGFALAVGSSGPPANIALALERMGAPSAFAVVVHGADVTRGKPDPQVFEMAAARLGVPPPDCAVIEDAPAGIAAANAAGMASVALVSTGRHAADFADANADLTVTSLRALSPPLIRRLIEKASAHSNDQETMSGY
ncbi:MAG: HAD family hydrolase [Planctomycetota bacterium]|jgi:beta-phosphoglucomutase